MRATTVWVLQASWFAVRMVMAVLVCVALSWLIMQWLFGLRLMNVQTGSMAPIFRPGDALVMRRLDPAQVNVLRPGMIVTYKSPRNPNDLVTHRVVWAGGGSFQTKGEALSVPDPPVRGDLLVGKVAAVLPGMGTLLGWLTTWPGLVVCVYAPVGAIVMSELLRLERAYGRRRLYRLPRFT